MIDKHSKTLLVIVAEATLEARLVRDARQLGAHVWTVVEVRGGAVEGEREGRWEADRTIELKVVCDAPSAEAIARHVLDRYAANYSVALYFAEVGVVRADHF